MGAGERGAVKFSVPVPVCLPTSTVLPHRQPVQRIRVRARRPGAPMF